MNPLAINSSIQCREAFVKSSAPCAFDPYYTFLSYNYYYISYFLVARDGVTFNFNFKQHLFFFLQHRGMTPAAFLHQQAALPGGGPL